VEIKVKGFLNTFNKAYLELAEVANVSCTKYSFFLSPHYRTQIKYVNMTNNNYENEADHLAARGYVE